MFSKAVQVAVLAAGLIALIFAPASAKDAGPQAYADNCSSCHGEALGGSGFGPALNTPTFQAKWRDRGQDELNQYIRFSMPPGAPGALGPDVYSAVSAYLAQANAIGRGTQSAGAASTVRPAVQIGLVPLTVGGRTTPDPIYEAALARRREIAGRVTPVTDQMLRAPRPEDWLTVRGQDSRGYSPLAQINRGNVAKLEAAWTTALGAGTNAIAPIVHDGVMFLNVSGRIKAMDAASGELLWEHVGDPSTTTGVPVSQPRGLALYEDKVYVSTLDGLIIALDARTGAKRWTHRIFEPRERLQLTSAPLMAHGMVVQGVAGCSINFREGGCFIVGVDAQTGKEAWRFQTIARPGEPGGDSWNGAPLSDRFGGSVWTVGSYDPDLDLVYFGVAQTYKTTPLTRPNPQPGGSSDALFTDATVALDPRTGKLVWFFQHLAGDVWDSDWSFEQTIADIGPGGRPAVVTIGKVGIIDAVDAQTGKFLFSHDFGVQTLIKAIDPKTGRKTINPDSVFVGKPGVTCPGNGGARNWPATSYDPSTGVLFVPLTESCMDVYMLPGGEQPVRSIRLPPNSDGKFGRLAAYDLRARKLVWMTRERAPPVSAIVATAGGLVFQGWRDRSFRAVDSATGEVLWRTRLDDMPNSFPITYAVDGKQYVAVVSGGGTPLEILQRNLTPELEPPSGSRTLWVFKLPD